MQFIKNIFLFLLTSFCMILLMEFYFTQTEIMQPISGEVDKRLGFVYSKKQDFTMFNEGFSLGHINSYGYLEKNYPREKKSDVFRIAVLGDSYVQGLQVFERSHFTTGLGNELNQYANKEVQILNFGVSGHNLSDMYCYVEDKVQKFKPNLILFLISENDLEEVGIAQKKKGLHPYPKIENNSLKITYDFVDNVKYRIYNKAKFLFGLSFGKLANKVYLLIQNKKTLPILFDKLYSPPKKAVQTLKKQEKEIPKVSKLILQELKKQQSIIVYRDTISQRTMNFIENEIGLRTINLNDTLNHLKSNGIDPNYWKVTKQRGHWNRDGHKAVGLFLAKKIREMNLTKKSKK